MTTPPPNPPSNPRESSDGAVRGLSRKTSSVWESRPPSSTHPDIPYRLTHRQVESSSPSSQQSASTVTSVAASRPDPVLASSALDTAGSEAKTGVLSRHDDSSLTDELAGSKNRVTAESSVETSTQPAHAGGGSSSGRVVSLRGALKGSARGRGRGKGANTSGVSVGSSLPHAGIRPNQEIDSAVVQNHEGNVTSGSLSASTAPSTSVAVPPNQDSKELSGGVQTPQNSLIDSQPTINNSSLRTPPRSMSPRPTISRSPSTTRRSIRSPRASRSPLHSAQPDRSGSPIQSQRNHGRKLSGVQSPNAPSNQASRRASPTSAGIEEHDGNDGRSGDRTNPKPSFSPEWSANVHTVGVTGESRRDSGRRGRRVSRWDSERKPNDSQERWETHRNRDQRLLDKSNARGASRSSLAPPRSRSTSRSGLDAPFLSAPSLSSLDPNSYILREYTAKDRERDRVLDESLSGGARVVQPRNSGLDRQDKDADGDGNVPPRVSGDEDRMEAEVGVLPGDFDDSRVSISEHTAVSPRNVEHGRSLEVERAAGEQKSERNIALGERTGEGSSGALKISVVTGPDDNKSTGDSALRDSSRIDESSHFAQSWDSESDARTESPYQQLRVHGGGALRRVSPPRSDESSGPWHRGREPQSSLQRGGLTSRQSRWGPSPHFADHRVFEIHERKAVHDHRSMPPYPRKDLDVPIKVDSVALDASISKDATDSQQLPAVISRGRESKSTEREDEQMEDISPAISPLRVVTTGSHRSTIEKGDKECLEMSMDVHPPMSSTVPAALEQEISNFVSAAQPESDVLEPEIRSKSLDPRPPISVTLRTMPPPAYSVVNLDNAEEEVDYGIDEDEESTSQLMMSSVPSSSNADFDNDPSRRHDLKPSHSLNSVNGATEIIYPNDNKTGSNLEGSNVSSKVGLPLNQTVEGLTSPQPIATSDSENVSGAIESQFATMIISFTAGIADLHFSDNVLKLRAFLKDLYPNHQNDFDAKLLSTFLLSVEAQSGSTSHPESLSVTGFVYDGKRTAGSGHDTDKRRIQSADCDIGEPSSISHLSLASPNGLSLSRSPDAVGHTTPSLGKRTAGDELENGERKRARREELDSILFAQSLPRPFDEVERILSNRDRSLEDAVAVVESLNTSGSASPNLLSRLLGEAFLRSSSSSLIERVTQLLDGNTTWTLSDAIVVQITTSQELFRDKGVEPWRKLFWLIRRKSYVMPDQVAFAMADALSRYEAVDDLLEFYRYIMTTTPAERTPSYLKEVLFTLLDLTEKRQWWDAAVELADTIFACNSKFERDRFSPILRGVCRARRLDLADRLFESLKQRGLHREFFEDMLSLTATPSTAQRALQLIKDMIESGMRPTHRQLALVKGACTAAGTTARFITVWQETLHKFSSRIDVEMDLCSEVVEMCLSAQLYPQAFWTVSFMKTRNFDLHRVFQAILASIPAGLRVPDPLTLALDIRSLGLTLSDQERSFFVTLLEEMNAFEEAAHFLTVPSLSDALIDLVTPTRILRVLANAVPFEALAFLLRHPRLTYDWHDLAKLVDYLVKTTTSSSHIHDIWEQHLSGELTYIPSIEVVRSLIEHTVQGGDWKSLKMLISKLRVRKAPASASQIRLILHALEFHYEEPEARAAAFEMLEDMVPPLSSTFKVGSRPLLYVDGPVLQKWFREIGANWSAGSLCAILESVPSLLLLPFDDHPEIDFSGEESTLTPVDRHWRTRDKVTSPGFDRPPSETRPAAPSPEDSNLRVDATRVLNIVQDEKPPQGGVATWPVMSPPFVKPTEREFRHKVVEIFKTRLEVYRISGRIGTREAFKNICKTLSEDFITKRMTAFFALSVPPSEYEANLESEISSIVDSELQSFTVNTPYSESGGTGLGSAQFSVEIASERKHQDGTLSKVVQGPRASDAAWMPVDASTTSKDSRSAWEPRDSSPRRGKEGVLHGADRVAEMGERSRRSSRPAHDGSPPPYQRDEQRDLNSFRRDYSNSRDRTTADAERESSSRGRGDRSRGRHGHSRRPNQGRDWEDRHGSRGGSSWNPDWRKSRQ
ncbi:hypothetical protein HDU93_008773 [Gonapodya sp. JEL0774]|nr:hypothetical protein HDU93_008773 [Gonapodya sp. JEL0774]